MAITRRPARLSVSIQPVAPQLTTMVRGEAVDEQDRLAFPVVEEGDVDPVGGEMLPPSASDPSGASFGPKPRERLLSAARRRYCPGRPRGATQEQTMADHVVPHFQNDAGVPIDRPSA